MKKIYYLAIISLTVFACGKEKPVNQESNQYQLTKQQIEIPHDTLLLGNLSEITAIGSDSILAFNSQSREFLIIDIAKKKIKASRKFSIEGPNFLDMPLRSIQFLNNKLYVLSNSYFSVFDFKTGEVLNRIGPDDIKDFNTVDNYWYFNLINEDSILFARTSNAAMVIPTAEDRGFSVITSLRLDPFRYDSLPIHSPEESLVFDKTKGFYNDFAMHQLLPLNNKIYVTYPFTSNIQVINSENFETEWVKINPEFAPSMKEPLLANDYTNAQKYVEYRYSGPKYFRLHYVKDLDIFFRYYLNLTLATDTKGPTSESRILLFNKDLQIIGEIKLNGSKVADPILLNNKITFLVGNQEFEDRTQFITYSIERK